MGFFRTLRADEIECRINQIKEGKADDDKKPVHWLTLLLYKTARTDASLLDETVGPARWENDFKLVDGVLFCGIGVDYDDNGKFIWKWDAGVESNTEAEKGRASDAFKRAGFKHGIGRALYSAPRITIFSNNPAVTFKTVGGKIACYDNFEVAEIAYDDNEHISRLVIASNGKPCYEWSAGKTASQKVEEKKAKPAKKPAPKPADAFVDLAEKADEHFSDEIVLCEECNGTVEDTTINGKTYTKADIIYGTRKKYAKTLCMKCALKHKDEKAG